jgi:hypothetical protein
MHDRSVIARLTATVTGEHVNGVRHRVCKCATAGTSSVAAFAADPLVLGIFKAKVSREGGLAAL